MRKIDIISFPKCGRTWLRYFLFRYLTFLTGEEKIEEKIGLYLPYFAYKNKDLPYINLTHYEIDSVKIGRFRPEKFTKYLIGQKVIILFRSPKDVLVSYFFQIRYRDKKNWWGNLDAPFWRRPDNLSDFILKSGITERFFDFYNALAVRLSMAEEYLIVNYEDMIKDPDKEFTKILKFCDIPFVEPYLRKAIKESDFSAMKQAEKIGIDHTVLRTKKDALADAFKVRRGKVDGYLDYLSETEIKYIDDCTKGLAPIFKC